MSHAGYTLFTQGETCLGAKPKNQSEMGVWSLSPMSSMSLLFSKDTAPYHESAISWPASQLESSDHTGGHNLAMPSATHARHPQPGPHCQSPFHRLLPGQLLLGVSLPLLALVKSWGVRGLHPSVLNPSFQSRVYSEQTFVGGWSKGRGGGTH